MAEFKTKDFRVQSTSQQRAIPLRPGFPWYFAHSSLSWEVVEIDGVDRWVPMLRRRKIMPGANGVPQNGDATKMEFLDMKRGWTIIENGGDAGEYCHPCLAQHKDEHGRVLRGNVWLDIWVMPHEFAPGMVKMVMTDDAKLEFNKWRAALIDNGLIKAPDKYLLEHVMDIYEDAHIKRHAARMGDVAVARKVEQAQGRLKKMKGAVLCAPEPPAPKATRRRPRG